MKRFAVLMFLGAVFLSACSAGRWVRTPVLEERQFSISLEHRIEDGRIVEQNYDHPYKVDLPSLEKLLTDLLYIEESGLFKSEAENPVFQNMEIDRLAPVLANAMANATPNQRIFFTSFNRGQGLLFKTTRKTEGVIFLEPENKINIAFTLINFEVEPNDVNELTDNLTRIDPLKIKSSETTLIPALSYAKHHTLESGKPYPMWIVADLDKLQASLTAEPQPLSQEPGPNSSLKVTTDAGKIGAKPVAKPPSATQAEDDPQKRIKNNLTYLKELFEEGLISKQEYETKKKEILDNIN